MSKNDERAGLGKVIYDHDEPNKKSAEESEELEETQEVLEADKESFPASDPPSFAGGTKNND